MCIALFRKSRGTPGALRCPATLRRLKCQILGSFRSKSVESAAHLSTKHPHIVVYFCLDNFIPLCYGVKQALRAKSWHLCWRVRLEHLFQCLQDCPKSPPPPIFQCRTLTVPESLVHMNSKAFRMLYRVIQQPHLFTYAFA